MPASSTSSPPSTPSAAHWATLLVDCAIALGVVDYVIAPGSRSAPLTAALGRAAQAGRVRTVLVFDERSAGYVALGMAQRLQRPAAVVCTSGTAAANLGPAVVEAFYQQIPLLLLTADRPAEWIDQEDNQAIRQTGLYGEHVRGAMTLSLSESHADAAWYVRRTISDAVQVATALPMGPVQINLPAREPLYGDVETPPAHEIAPARVVSVTPQIAESAWPSLLETWRRSPRRLIVAGMHVPDDGLAAALRALSIADPDAVVVGDVTNNLLPALQPVQHWDSALAGRDPALLDALAPDLVVTLGGQVTSKALKAFLRARPPSALWRVAPGLPAPDTWQALTHVLPLPAAPFVAALAERLAADLPSQFGYAQIWRAASERARAALDAALDGLSWSEIWAVRRVLDLLPTASALQVGNSLPIRYVNLLGFAADHHPATVHANRGTSGIDGVVSTAVGAALADPATLTTLLVGDLSFFYDRNGLWLRPLPANLRVVVLNNHGGGIFDVIAGPDQLPADLRRDYFLTPHAMTARRTAEDAGLRYHHAAHAAALDNALTDLFSAEAGPALLEIETDMATNSAAFRQVMRSLQVA